MSAVLPVCHAAYNQNFLRGSVFVCLQTHCQNLSSIQEDCLVMTITAETWKQFRNKDCLVYAFSSKLRFKERLRSNPNRKYHWFNSWLSIMSAIVCSQNLSEAFFLLNLKFWKSIVQKFCVCFSFHNWCMCGCAVWSWSAGGICFGCSGGFQHRSVVLSLLYLSVRWDVWALQWGWSSWNVPDGGSDSPKYYCIAAAAQWHRGQKGILSRMTCTKSGNSAHLLCCTEGICTGQEKPNQSKPQNSQPHFSQLWMHSVLGRRSQ